VRPLDKQALALLALYLTFLVLLALNGGIVPHATRLGELAPAPDPRAVPEEPGDRRRRGPVAFNGGDGLETTTDHAPASALPSVVLTSPPLPETLAEVTVATTAVGLPAEATGAALSPRKGLPRFR
jgi:hypothetical protein